MATQKSNKKKLTKPKTQMRAQRHSHAFVLEQDGRVTCECDPFMTFANGAGEAQKISEWFNKVALYLREKNK